MNKEILTKMKSFYEDAISTKLSESLGADKKNIKVIWAIDETKVKVDMTTGDIVTTFNFVYKSDNLSVEMESYKVLFNEVDGARYINGVQAKSSTVDLQTILALHNIFKDILEQEYVEDEAPIAADVAESAAEPTVAETDNTEFVQG